MLHAIYNFFVIHPECVTAVAWVLPAIMAAAGAVKGMTIDKAKADSQRQLAAETQRWSPWTGMSAGPVQEADPFGNALSFGSTGLALSQGFENADAGKELQKAQVDYLRSRTPSILNLKVDPSIPTANGAQASIYGRMRNPYNSRIA